MPTEVIVSTDSAREVPPKARKMIDKESIRNNFCDPLGMMEQAKGLPYKRQRTLVENNSQPTITQSLASGPDTGFNPPLIKIFTSSGEADI